MTDNHTENYNRYLRVKNCSNFTINSFEDMLALDLYLREFTGNPSAEIRPDGLWNGEKFLEDEDNAEDFFDWMEMQLPLPEIPDWGGKE